MQLYGRALAAMSRHARLPNTTEWTAHTPRGDYLVQVAWPLHWNEDRTGPEDDIVNTVYVLTLIIPIQSKLAHFNRRYMH